LELSFIRLSRHVARSPVDSQSKSWFLYNDIIKEEGRRREVRGREENMGN
jgi:hypothetical protein